MVETSKLEARYRPGRERKGIALCLSGGGFRAALFHAGAIRRLNELGVLSRVRTISSVSGGSIASGLLATVWTRLARVGDRFTNLESLFEQPLRAFCGSNIRNGTARLARTSGMFAALQDIDAQVSSGG